MDKNKNWMLMTYYCPTHGELGRAEPVELTKEEIKDISLTMKNTKKAINP